MIVDIAVPYPVDGSFHYEIAEERAKDLVLGSLVRVPFGKRETLAFVVGFPGATNLEPGRLKSILEIIFPDPIFDEKMLRFLRWVSEYYCHPFGEVLSAAIPKECLKPPGKRKSRAAAPLGMLGQDFAKPALTEEQTLAVSSILSPEANRPILLHGVTGSGKTEVYMAVIEQGLHEGKGAMVLVPEIALTPQLLGRFSARFPGQVAILHSDLTPKVRAEQWAALRQDRARIVIGARSAIFAPLQNLGTLIVDEEHESSFKQEEGFRYHARDIAIVRAQFAGARIILGSATPSLESYENARKGKYLYVRLKNRVNRKPMPTTTIVDLKSEGVLYDKKIPWLSQVLYGKLTGILGRKEQALLYLNRLGFAHFLFCQDCGHTWRCRNCDVALTYYRTPPELKCHYCGLTLPPPGACDVCAGQHVDTMGIGTEQVERTLQALFPNARVARFDRSKIKNRKDLEEILNRIQRREVDIVVGTQMIAKGHDFPAISLVGILFADSHLNIPDFRAHERTFQVLTQVSGRAGRADIPGEVLIQTVNPEHPILLLASKNEADEFYKRELEQREAFGFPPFQRLALVRLQHRHPAKVEAFSCELVNQLRRYLGEEPDIALLGPASAPLSKVKGLYRWHFMVKSGRVALLRKALHFVWTYAEAKKSPVQIALDIDPVNSI